MSELLTYVYAVARRAEGLEQATHSLKGVADASVHVVAAEGDDDTVLLASRVPAEDFAEDGLKRHLEDLDWLEAVARAHNAVVEAVATHTTVLPFRLATVYLNDARAREEVLNGGGKAVLSKRLALLAEQVEWGVKIYVEPPAASAAAAEPASTAGLSAGRAYLRNRRHQQSARDIVYRAAQLAAERVEVVGREYATDRARHGVQQGVLARDAGENIVNDAYLVPRERGEEFRAAVTHTGEGLDGVRVEVTGPWAPYSFVLPPDSPGGVAEEAAS